MAISSYEIGLATRDDVTGILDLQERNLRSLGGALSVRFSRDWFEAAISDMPIIVARLCRGKPSRTRFGCCDVRGIEGAVIWAGGFHIHPA